MKEKLLQFIWQFQYFNKSNLFTTLDKPIIILVPGHINFNQGPDFTDAKIKSGETIWVGNIEIHIHSSDWNLHKHSNDKNYNNIILHVVWVHDMEIQDINGVILPTLELRNLVSKVLLNRYEELMQSSLYIPCQMQITLIDELVLSKWKERLVIERLIRRTKVIDNLLSENNTHWEETFWWLLARNFGITVNSDCFEKIARSIPLHILSNHKDQIHKLEAILFGQASLLDQKFNEAYPIMLQKEYNYYKKKYNLQKIPLHLFFLRMRPANFPSLRLAQLAMLLSKSSHLFSKIKDALSIKQVINILEVTANDYWHYHYRFDEPGTYKKKAIGAHMINNIIINTIVPVLFAYGCHHNDNRYKEKAVHWLEQIEGEKNAIIKGFQEIGLTNKNAFTSQALIEMKSFYCDAKRCLECSIGNALLNNKNNIGPV